MSYGMVEPSVVDEEMLQMAVEEQGPQHQAGRIAKEEGIQYSKVLQLRLEYRNIKKIDHLWQFRSLTKLQLNSNIIEKIEGLETLINLTWLDLSFNNITKIEGLESLVKLESLSLYDNQISVIENIDTLQNLLIFSIGNNLLDQLENVMYLRKFQSLCTLNLAGNPICQDENYKSFIAAFLPDLVYLDYIIVDEQTKKEAYSVYQHAIKDLRSNELQAQKDEKAKQSQEDELQLHKSAFVEHLNGSYLFDSMFIEDPETKNLAYLPGVADLRKTFESQLVGLCGQVFEIGLVQHERRKAEVQSFFDCLEEAVKDNQQRAAEVQSNFERTKKKRTLELQQLTDTYALANQFGEEINHLCDRLMTLELQLVDQLEDTIKDFDRNISDMVGSFIETAQGIFAQCRDLENHNHEKMLEIAMVTLEKAAKNELEEDVPDDLRMMLVDKDTVMNAVNASHDTHLLKIDNREDELVTRINNWMSILVKEVQDEELNRHSKRISEIQKYIDYLRNWLEAMQ